MESRASVVDIARGKGLYDVHDDTSALGPASSCFFFVDCRWHDIPAFSLSLGLFSPKCVRHILVWCELQSWVTCNFLQNFKIRRLEYTDDH